LAFGTFFFIKSLSNDPTGTDFLVNMQRLTNSQRYLVNAKPGTDHSTNPTRPNPNGNSKR